MMYVKTLTNLRRKWESIFCFVCSLMKLLMPRKKKEIIMTLILIIINTVRNVFYVTKQDFCLRALIVN